MADIAVSLNNLVGGQRMPLGIVTFAMPLELSLDPLVGCSMELGGRRGFVALADHNAIGDTVDV
jgi:hypothetical protein